MKIRANGINVNYELAGSGPCVTLSHSLASNLHVWDGQMAALTKHYTVLRYDTRGHGASDAPAGAYTLEELADDAYELLQALGITHTQWVGLSMGGMIGQTFALRYPTALRGLVLADTTSRIPAEAGSAWDERIRSVEAGGMAATAEATLVRWFTEPYRASNPRVIERIREYICSTPVLGFVGCCRAISTLNLTHRLREISCPSLVIVGEQDPGTPVETAREMHAAMAGSELVILAQAAHLSNVEQVNAFNDAVIGFLDRTRP